MSRFRVVGAVYAFIAGVVLVGCSNGGDFADVSGTVSYDGHAIESGAITFIPADGKGSTAGGPIKDGKYTATKVPLGNMKVSISGSKKTGSKKLYPTADSPSVDLTAEALPTKYSDRDKSELTFEVKRGANEKNWELPK